MSVPPAVEQFERRLRKDYESHFPASTTWELGALHLLLAYDYYARQSDGIRAVDVLKYPLMHAFRWGANAPSQPLSVAPGQAAPDLFNTCWDVLRLANDYTAVYGAFRQFEKGVVEIESCSDHAITFTANPAWHAYEELDRLLQERPCPNRRRPETMAAINRTIENVLGLYSDFRNYFPNINDFSNALPTVGHIAEEGFELPDSWSFDGISIATLRRFWTALMLFGIIHNSISQHLVGSRTPNLYHLIIRPKDRLVGWLGECLELDKPLVARLIDLHTYDRRHYLPDIALTPFLALSDDILAVSPWLLLTSRFERNFSAFVARNYKPQYDAVTHTLAPFMADQLAGAFRAVGLKVERSVPIHTSKGDGDIDLLVWSPEDRWVLGVELKWVIGVGDIMEVFNRGESTCLVSIQKQIPKYREALQNATGLIQCAFSLDEAPQLDGWCCAMMTRGFVGSPRVVTAQCLFIPEQPGLERLGLRCSLREFCQWATAMPYLPVEGQHFQLTHEWIESPSGYKVAFWDRDKIKVETEGDNQME